MGVEPSTLALPTQRSHHHAGQVFLPRRQRHDRQDQSRGIGIGVVHHPPPKIIGFGREAQGGASKGQTASQDLLGFVQTLLARRHGGQPLQDVEPVDDGCGGPLLRCQRNRIEHACLGTAIARQSLNGSQATHIVHQPALRACRGPHLALQAPLHKGAQALQHGVTSLRWQLKTRLMADCEQVGRQVIRTVPRRPCHRRKVGGQAIVIQVGRQLAADVSPHLGIVQAHRLGHFLFQADVGVLFKIAADARQVAGQGGLQSHADATTGQT